MPLDNGPMAVTRLKFLAPDDDHPEEALLAPFGPDRDDLIAGLSSLPFTPIDPASGVTKRVGFIPFFNTYEASPTEWLIAGLRVQSRGVDKNEVNFLTRHIRSEDRKVAEENMFDGEKPKIRSWTECENAARAHLLKKAGMKSQVIHFAIRGRFVYVFGGVSQANLVREYLSNAKFRSAVYAPWITKQAKDAAPANALMPNNQSPHVSTHGPAFMRWLLSDGKPAVLEPDNGQITLETLVDKKRLKKVLEGPVCEDAYRSIKDGWYPMVARILIQGKCIKVDAKTLTFEGLHVRSPKKNKKGKKDKPSIEDWYEKIVLRINTAAAMVAQIDELFAAYLKALLKKEVDFMPDDFKNAVYETQESLFAPAKKETAA